MAVPQYLNWSNMPITFDRDDHPDMVVAPGVYPLVVDPIIVNTRLSKVLMDGGSSLKIITSRPSTSSASKGRSSSQAQAASVASCRERWRCR